MRKKTALFIGRFQPLHNGHVHAIKSALKKYDFLIIAVGSISKKGPENPFSYAERKKMIGKALAKYEGRYRIIGVRDTSDERWTRKVKKIRFDAVISGNSHVWKCLKGCDIEQPDFLKPKVYNGTKIRIKMGRGIPIIDLVPHKILKIIEKKKT